MQVMEKGKFRKLTERLAVSDACTNWRPQTFLSYPERSKYPAIDRLIERFSILEHTVHISNL